MLPRIATNFVLIIAKAESSLTTCPTSKFPFRFGGKPILHTFGFAQPFAEGNRIIPRDIYNGMMVVLSFIESEIGVPEEMWRRHQSVFGVA